MFSTRFRKVASRARIYVADGFADADEIAALLVAAEPGRYETKHDETGLSFELPVAAAPVLGALESRIEGAYGFSNAWGGVFRFRRYREGEFHPPHCDVYEFGDAHLVATAMLWLVEPEAGGETRFGEVDPQVRLAPRAGRLAVWINETAEGAEDPASEHEGLPVLAGEKVTLTCFVYAPPGSVPALARSAEPEADIPGVTFESPRR